MGSPVPTDAELVALARAGDVPALAGIFERHRPALYAAAVGLLGNRADAMDAVQDTAVTTLVRLAEIRDPAAVRGWLHAVLRNTCLMRLRQRRELPRECVEPAGVVPSPEELLERHAMREWIWRSIDTLGADERLALILRYFTRCTGYEEIARITAVPVGTVRSRLNRARNRLAGSLATAASGAAADRARVDRVETQRYAQWADFYRVVHDRPVAATYRPLFAPDVDVRDTAGHWAGIGEWSAHEREAIDAGVRARLVGVLASRDTTVLEIDFTNPGTAPDHCPPRATFVHHLRDGRSTRLRIHYPA